MLAVQANGHIVIRIFFGNFQEKFKFSKDLSIYYLLLIIIINHTNIHPFVFSTTTRYLSRYDREGKHAKEKVTKNVSKTDKNYPLEELNNVDISVLCNR